MKESMSITWSLNDFRNALTQFTDSPYKEVADVLNYYLDLYLNSKDETYTDTLSPYEIMLESLIDIINKGKQENVRFPKSLKYVNI